MSPAAGLSCSMTMSTRMDEKCAGSSCTIEDTVRIRAGRVSHRPTVGITTMIASSTGRTDPTKEYLVWHHVRQTPLRARSTVRIGSVHTTET